MKPSIEMGDMIVTGPAGGVVSPEIRPGAIVTFEMGESLVTHRVVSVDGSMLTTRGDAVEDADSQPVAASQVVGVYLFRIPKLGYVNAFVHTWPGLIMLFILAGVLLTSIIREIVRDSRRSAQCDVGR
jgi:signal peptidase